MTAGQAPMARYTPLFRNQLRARYASGSSWAWTGRQGTPRRSPGVVAGPQGPWRPLEEVARREDRGSVSPWLSFASGAAAGAASRRKREAPEVVRVADDWGGLGRIPGEEAQSFVWPT